jgi:hypothetical protein
MLWAIWHLPVIDYLGTATPHGAYWFSFLLAFSVAMTAMRVLICWIYINTKSVPVDRPTNPGAFLMAAPIAAQRPLANTQPNKPPATAIRLASPTTMPRISPDENFR